MCIGWASNGDFLLLLHHGREDWQHQGLILWMKGCSSFVSFDWCDHHRSRVINQPATWAAQGKDWILWNLHLCKDRHRKLFYCPAINRIKLSFFPSPGFSNQQRHCLEQGGRLLHNLLHTSNTRRVSISYFAAPWEATKKIGFFIITIRIRIFQYHQLKKWVVGCTPSYTQQATHGHSSPVARTHEQSRASTQDEANILLVFGSKLET